MLWLSKNDGLSLSVAARLPWNMASVFFSLKKGEAARDLVMLRVPRVQTEIQVVTKAKHSTTPWFMFRPLPHHRQLPWTGGPDWPSSLAAYHTSAFWGEAWWRVQEFRQSELPGDSHRKPMKSGGGHPLAHRDRPLPLSPALSRLISVPSRRQWWGTSCRSCGGSTVAGVKWLHGPRSFPSLHQEPACLSCGKALRL